jgi:hypothetical protein
VPTVAEDRKELQIRYYLVLLLGFDNYSVHSKSSYFALRTYTRAANSRSQPIA